MTNTNKDFPGVSDWLLDNAKKGFLAYANYASITLDQETFFRPDTVYLPILGINLLFPLGAKHLLSELMIFQKGGYDFDQGIRRVDRLDYSGENEHQMSQLIHRIIKQHK